MNKKQMASMLLILFSFSSWGKELGFLDGLKQQYAFVPIYDLTISSDGKMVTSKMDAALKGKRQNMAFLWVYTSVKIKGEPAVMQMVTETLFDCRNQSISYGTNHVFIDEKGDRVMSFRVQTPFKNQEQILKEGSKEAKEPQEKAMAINMTQAMFRAYQKMACTA